MKEFGFDIDLWKGLRKYSDQRREVDSLVECVNAVPKGEERGLVQYNEVINPMSSITVTWPFPQLFRGKGVTLLAYETAIYTVNETTWVPTLITTYDAFDISNTKSITAGGVWHFMDFYDTWMLFNGKCVVFHTERYNIFGGTDKTLVQDAVTVQTGCDFRGRGLMGGFKVSDFQTTDWQTFWSNWLLNKPSGMTISETIDTNFVLWTSIGGGDLLWLFYKDIAESGFTADGFHDAVRPLVFEQMRRNERGFMPMPWQGTILKLAPLGNKVIVYGDGGISALVPYAEPVPTFGLVDVLGVGVAERGAVAVGPMGHVFVDQTGMLWLIDGELKLRQLGYQEYFRDMIGNDIVGTYDPLENEYRLCSGTKGYLWSPGGLCEISQLVTSAARVGADDVGIFVKTGDGSMVITTDVFDMKMMGIKNVSQVDLGASASTTAEVAIDYRYKTGDKFYRSGWKRVNQYGTVFPNVSGIEFRLVIRANPYDAMKYDRVSVRWKSSDKRFVRGAYTKQQILGR